MFAIPDNATNIDLVFDLLMMSPTQKDSEEWSCVYSGLKKEWDALVVAAKTGWEERGLCLGTAAEEGNVGMQNNLTAPVATARTVWQEQEMAFYEQLSAVEAGLAVTGEFANPMLAQFGGLDAEVGERDITSIPKLLQNLDKVYAAEEV